MTAYHDRDADKFVSTGSVLRMLILIKDVAGNTDTDTELG